MKKNVYLFIFIFFLISKGVAQTNYKYHEFAELGGTFQQAKNNYCDNIRVQSYKINVNIDSPLPIGNIYRVDLGFGKGLKYYKVTKAFDFPTNDSDEDAVNGNIFSLSFTITCPGPDSDGDGVPDNQDECPNQPGPPSNNGCPEDQGEPDLVLDKNGTIITSECSGCSPFLNNLGSGRHIISRNGGSINFQLIVITNAGDGNSGSSKTGIYLSDDTELSSDDFKFKSLSVSSISAGNSKDTSTNILGADFDYNQAFGNYYLLIVLDDEKSISESNENNNTTAIPIRYRENF